MTPNDNNINIELVKPLTMDFPLHGNHISAFSCISIEEYPIHSHLHMEIIYIAKGSLRIKIGVSEYTLGAGEFTIINPFELHALYATDDVNMTCILEINSSFYDPCSEETIFVSAYHLYKDAAGKDFDRITATLKKIFFLHLAAASVSGRDPASFPSAVAESDAEYEKVLLRSLINYFELHFTSEYFLLSDHRENTLRDNALQANRLKSIMNYFYEHFPQKIQLQDVADLTFVNRYHISHLVKEGIGYTFSELLQYIRIEKSEVYLLGTDMPINQIVFELGFSSYRYFSQHFKNVFHMTPTAYRKKYRMQTIRYKSLSCLAPTGLSDIRDGMALFSAENGSDASESEERGAVRHLITLRELRHPVSVHGKPIAKGEIDLPDKSPLYDSPFFPALLLHIMSGDPAGFLRRFPAFFRPDSIRQRDRAGSPFSGLPGNVTVNGIKKSTYYLTELMGPFLSGGTVSLPGCLFRRSGGDIHMLFFNLPDELAVLGCDAPARDDIITLAERALTAPPQRWMIDTEDLMPGRSMIVRTHTFATDLDAFVQWQRLGSPAAPDEELIGFMNDGSAPRVRLDMLPASALGTSYELTLSPFEVRYISLRDFTALP